MKISVLLADDHAVVRDGLRALLDAEPDLHVEGTAADGREAVHLARQLHPGVVILDIAMPGLNGLSAARQILESCPGTQVIMLTMHATDAHVQEALRIGARGYLLKAAAGAEVAHAVRAVYAGHRYLSEPVLDQVIGGSLGQRPALADPHLGALARLTERECEVLQLVVEGQTSAEAAVTLGLSLKTVESYRSSMMKKLEIDNVPDLVRFAIRHGLATLE